MSPEAYDVTFTLNPSKATGINMLSKRMSSGEGSEFGATDSTDPFIFWDNLSFDTAEVDAILITLRTDVSTEGYLYFSAGSQKTYNSDQKVQFTIQNDGQFHTVLIPMQDAVDYRNKQSKVDKLIMVDSSDRQGDAADPESLAAVGFDVRDAGVIGVILLDDGTGARLT